MEKIQNIIIFTTSYLVFYVVGAQLGVLPEKLIIAMFATSPFLVGFMAFKILKDGIASELNWEDGYWYEDEPQMMSARQSSPQ